MSGPGGARRRCRRQADARKPVSHRRHPAMMVSGQREGSGRGNRAKVPARQFGAREGYRFQDVLDKARPFHADGSVNFWLEHWARCDHGRYFAVQQGGASRRRCRAFRCCEAMTCLSGRSLLARPGKRTETAHDSDGKRAPPLGLLRTTKQACIDQGACRGAERRAQKVFHAAFSVFLLTNMRSMPPIRTG